MAIGDFNEIKSNNEKKDGPPRMLNVCDFVDLKYIGVPFSWVGKRHHHDVSCCLDRTLVNNAWLSQYLASHSEFLEIDRWLLQSPMILIRDKDSFALTTDLSTKMALTTQ